MAQEGISHSDGPPIPSAAGGFKTFSRLPVLASDGDEAIDLAFLGIPFDGLVTFRAGARLGPAAIRQSSGLCRNYSQQMEIAVFDRLRAFDAGDVAVDPVDYEQAFRQIENEVLRLQGRGARVVCLGGDHSILLPILRATSRTFPRLTIIQFDAHADTSDESASGQRFHHGTWVRRAIEEGLVEGPRMFQIGVRGFLENAEYNDFSRSMGIRGLSMQGVHRETERAAFIEMIREAAGDGPCYVTFDVDGVDPAFAPGTGTPVVGGLTSYEALDILRSLRGLPFIGGDVVEVAPAYDTSEITSLLGAALALEIGALIALAPQRARGR